MTFDERPLLLRPSFFRAGGGVPRHPDQVDDDAGQNGAHCGGGADRDAKHGQQPDLINGII